MTQALIILACLAASAFFSGSETALLRLRAEDVAHGDDEPSGPATSAVRALLESTSRLLVTILLGNNVVNILGAAVASAWAVATLGPELGVAAATLVMTLLVLVFCEVLPKAVAAAHPHGVARSVALPLYLIHRIVAPLHRLFDRALDPIVVRIAGRSEPGSRDGAEAVMRMARELRAGMPSGGAVSIIGATAAAAEMTVHEIMIDRPQIFAANCETPAAELLDTMLDERYTRIPVYQGTIDTFLGFLHLKDLVRHVRAGRSDLREILKPVLRVPERKPILSLLADMQRTFTHLAIVKDENGVTLGMVTTEDILEELVGEIRDEFDREELQSIRRIDGDEFEALGRVKVLDFNRATDWEIPAERGDTLGGLVFNELGRSPRRGDRVAIPGFEVAVTDVSGTRIARVRIRRRREADED